MNWLFGDSSCESGLWFVYLDDYKLWSKNKHSSINCFAYLKIIDERNYATRLEF